LVQRGLVEIRRGKGTFVTHPKITKELTELTGFVEDMQAAGVVQPLRFLTSKSSRPTRSWLAAWHYRKARLWFESSASA
jgi:DNA-binding GntR family transcriptional regulator